MLNVVYEDNHLLIVEKPPNMLTQGDATGDPCLADAVKAYLKEKYQKPGDVYLGLVHRLDRPVGGLVALARTSKAASRLSDQLRT
ncbi:MAG: pseudouridine synthase, partial [Bacillota bacterium]